MRSLCAAALCFLAIITECLSAQSDRSRQRSGPIRSVPLAADIKRDIDFDCPEEFGYYPHPTDCTLYYVCVFGGALLESCTGGLMYSHELQTCDWPRNVGCDGTTVVAAEELERLSERERDPPPPPPPPRRTPPPPPPPRAQPNPVITSRGQPKFNRQEYEKQQQLYAVEDDLPPVEEIESDRQQRVYRGQPSTIGQVQKDRDGYSSQVNSGRNLNSNIIPALIPRNSGKIGSFSFGSQVDDRRAATITQAPQSYSADKNDNVTDSSFDRRDLKTNEINDSDITEKLVLRQKREIIQKSLGSNDTDANNVTDKSDNVQKSRDNMTITDKFSDRSDYVDFNQYFIETDTESTQNDNENNEDLTALDDSERGKRQVRYYLKDSYKNSGKNWASSKPISFIDPAHISFNQNVQNIRYPPTFNGLNNNNYEGTQKPYFTDNKLYSTSNSFNPYQTGIFQSQMPFKASLPDPYNQRLTQIPMNTATQIITKSPPISSLTNNENPFAALAGGFYNNVPQQDYKYSIPLSSQAVSSFNRPSNQVAFPDSSILPSTVVTDKPVVMSTTSRTRTKYRIKPEQTRNTEQSRKIQQPVRNTQVNQKVVNKQSPKKEEDYDDDDDEDETDDDEEEDESNEEEEEREKDDFKHEFPEPPYEFTHPTRKYADIQNPFANPNFDFDKYLSKLSEDHYTAMHHPTTAKPKQKGAITVIRPVDSTKASYLLSEIRTSTLTNEGVSTPRPFTLPMGFSSTSNPSIRILNLPLSSKLPQQYQKLVQIPLSPNQQSHRQQQQQQPFSENLLNTLPQRNVPLEPERPKLKPPNFNDDRQLPISYSFNQTIDITSTLQPNQVKEDSQQVFTATQKPYVFVTNTEAPIIVSTPKKQLLVNPERIISPQPHLVVTGKSYLVSSINPHSAYEAIKHSTSKPLTTLANEHLTALQHYWKSTSTESLLVLKPTLRPPTVSEIPKLHNLFPKTIKSSTPVPDNSLHAIKEQKTTTKATPKRRPIPKPSPEMNDYYYDDDEDYYYEPPVKSQYMPVSEVKPQRPPMAQNYKEYDDSYVDVDETILNNKTQPSKRPLKYVAHRPSSEVKNHNNLYILSKVSLKDRDKDINEKNLIPIIELATTTSTVVLRPEVSNYEIVHQTPQNTAHSRKPVPFQSGPNTPNPPKYLNQSTLRPYTVRHRLAKPTTVSETTASSEDNKQIRGRTRHHNIVAQKLTTPRDNHNQETRNTKTNHDDKANSLEPTESVVPVSYSASPRPKMLYNGSQNYSPDQYDPYYAVYDEDGELYKDTDYVQQYNTASLRPAVQQTYRGTPPPVRRPVQTYTPRPVSPDDYDDALIQGQISNQNQYQSPVRHSTRGEGNELGYDHNPSSVRTTLYEATTKSTTPSTTSTTTTTTTQRSTTALITEAMTPSRHTSRSSTDENPIRKPDSSSNQNPLDGSALSNSSTPSSTINFSTFAKPFEKTDNLNRLRDTLPSTESIPTSRLVRVTNNESNNKIGVDVVRPTSERDNKKIVSLTTGFSIRRNTNNTNNPYTLTVLTQPIGNFQKTRNKNAPENRDIVSSRYYINKDNDTQVESTESKLKLVKNNDEKLFQSFRRNDASPEIMSEEDDIPVYIRPNSRITSTSPLKTSTSPTTSTTKYYLKTVIRRPAPFSFNEQNEVSTERNLDSEAVIETTLQNTKNNFISTVKHNNSLTRGSSKWEPYNGNSESLWNEPIVSPYKTLSNLRNSYNTKDLLQAYSTSSETTTRLTTSTHKEILLNEKKSVKANPSYYSYKLDDDNVSDQTTEIFHNKVKNVVKTFLNDFSSTPKVIDVTSTTSTYQTENKVVNIGFQKNKLKLTNEKPLRSNVKRLQIITEPNLIILPSSTVDSDAPVEIKNEVNYFPTTTTTTTTSFTSIPLFVVPDTTPSPSMLVESSTNSDIHTQRQYQSKVNAVVTSRPEKENSRFYKLLTGETSTELSGSDNIANMKISSEIKTNKELTETLTDVTILSNTTLTNETFDEIASTTSTTRSTTTVKVGTTSTTKSITFPTRPSRVNPAIKLAATISGGGRRSYQSSSKCSSDNSLQANPKCNEIKYQRPTSTRGRGSAHYSTQSVSEAPQQQQQQQSNRGTPPTRSRPTLKPSTAIVAETKFVDIYAHPPGRPAPVYPQPTPDKTAAKCRKDVCLLPDCFCGGKDVPGDLPMESIPQIVLLTFDDSVNDLNKGLYADLFEKGRVNPNGCPISATFYVSHEWTDYSQVQNLYSAGHEMASHTVSHSFGEQFSQKKWNREVGGQREILAAYGGVKLEDVRGMRAPFLSVGGNKMFKMLYDSNFTYDSSLPVYENKPPSWPYTLDYKIFHDCMIPPCPTKSYPGVWEVPMVMWQDLNGGRCSMGDACANPPDAEGVYKMILKNFDRHYTTNRAPFGLYYHAAWFTQPHHKEGFIMFLDFINSMKDVWIVTNWQALQWVRDPTPIKRLNNFQPFQCNYQDRPKKCNNPKVCNLWHKSGVRYMRTCQPCPEVYPWTGKTGIKSSRIDNDIDE